MGGWREHLWVAWASLRAHKLRAGLTMLGVVIGVASVISVAAIIHGLNQYVADEVQRLGARMLIVSRFPAFRLEQWPEHIRLRKHFTYEDIDALRDGCQRCGIVTPVRPRDPFFGRKLNEIRFRNQSVEEFVLRGTEHNFHQVMPLFAVKEGRMFTEEENRQRRQVVVLGLAVSDALFGRLDPIGQTVRLNGIEFTVIGVWEQHSGLFGGPGADQIVVIPYRTFTKLYPEIEELVIGVEVSDPEQFGQISDEVADILRRRRSVAQGAPNDFELTTPDFIKDLWDQLTGALVALTMIVSSIALIVGGIGVMNIMLVSVTERTAEIGLRKAVGARRSDIRRQFLTEAVMLTGAGGVLGILLGAATAVATHWLMPTLPASLSLFWVVAGFGLAVGVGLFFGIYPAIRAAALEPVTCLRYE
ncbi:MAG: ABC transporter permease [Candidatus Acidiferrales bacterium]